MNKDGIRYCVHHAIFNVLVALASYKRFRFVWLLDRLTYLQEGEDDDPSTRRGFDSLRGNGMTRGEVTAIRGYFSSQVREVSERATPVTLW